jgi:hypothetical protein
MITKEWFENGDKISTPSQHVKTMIGFAELLKRAGKDKSAKDLLSEAKKNCQKLRLPKKLGRILALEQKWKNKLKGRGNPSRRRLAEAETPPLHKKYNITLVLDQDDANQSHLRRGYEGCNF